MTDSPGRGRQYWVVLIVAGWLVFVGQGTASCVVTQGAEVLCGVAADGGKSAVPAGSSDEAFSVVAYNVENLFDLDGVALFADYGPERYGPRQLLRKLQNHARVLKTVDDGRGPDIILFQELEADQTPGTTPFDWRDFQAKYGETSLETLLTEPVSDEVRDLPAEVFLWKALQEAGLGDYHVAVGQYRPDPTGRVVAHVNATFSRFPILEQQTHHTPGARGILEVVHDIDGAKLTTFNNHWKSGASDGEAEQIRWGNAETLRRRLEVLLAADPLADVVLGGDFNSQHNQSEAYGTMAKTALNTILGSQGDELKIRELDRLWLYNLWYELPVDERGSDVYQDQWGTLMQMMLTRGAYHESGIQYVDNSFEVLILEGVNAQVGTRLPLRWSSTETDGAGFSDHFPILSRFRRGGRSGSEDGYLVLQDPSRGESVTEFRRVDYGRAVLADVPRLDRFASDEEIRQLENLGQVFEVAGEVSGERPFRVKVYEQEYNIWAFDVGLRREIYSRYQVGDPIRLIAEIGVHQGNWQFVVRDLGWLKSE